MQATASISRFRSGVAALLASLVFALGLLAWMPDVHARLHAQGNNVACSSRHDDSAADHSSPTADEAGCVVTLFAQGLPAPMAAPVPLPVLLLAETPDAIAAQAAPAPSPERLHPPALAPPAAV